MQQKCNDHSVAVQGSISIGLSHRTVCSEGEIASCNDRRGALREPRSMFSRDPRRLSSISVDSIEVVFACIGVLEPSSKHRCRHARPLSPPSLLLCSPVYRRSLPILQICEARAALFIGLI